MAQLLLLLSLALLCVASALQAPLSRLRPTSTALHASLKPQLTKLIARQDLTSDETEQIWTEILSGADAAVVGAALTLLRAKGETPVEVAGMVRAMHKACKPVLVDGKLLDIVGTGGDGADTINISTASVVLAAGAGCRVAKAGNRSVSSRCGSADVLETLGVRIELSPEQVAESIKQCGGAASLPPPFSLSRLSLPLSSLLPPVPHPPTHPPLPPQWASCTPL